MRYEGCEIGWYHTRDVEGETKCGSLLYCTYPYRRRARQIFLIHFHLAYSYSAVGRKKAPPKTSGSASMFEYPRYDVKKR
jgi:hypothetical protein